MDCATCRVGLDEGVDWPDDAGLVAAVVVGVRAGDLEVGRRDVGEREAAAAVVQWLLPAHPVVLLCKAVMSITDVPLGTGNFPYSLYMFVTRQAAQHYRAFLLD